MHDDIATQPLLRWLERFDISVVVPCYRVEKNLDSVLRRVPKDVRYIIVVNDASPDGTASIILQAAARDPRIIAITHKQNQGVGGAMLSGFQKALELGSNLVVKIDGDGQMNPEDTPGLLVPLIQGKADYSKGNRFWDFRALRQMPLIRRTGNLVLSFLVKAATGYWNCFDPCNGFIAIRGDVLAQLPLHKVHRSYFFETSMLSNLGLLNAVVRDVPLPARYGNEVSSLSIKRVLLEFPPRLTKLACQRVLLKNFVYDFNMESVHLLFGFPMLLAGVVYGGWNWIRYLQLDRPAPSGTVVISALLIILGFQLLLSAVALDLQATPRTPICGGPLSGTANSASSRHLEQTEQPVPANPL